jgi:hypothetical protein
VPKAPKNQGAPAAADLAASPLTYDILASVTSPPFNLLLSLDGQRIKMARDGTGAWAGKAKKLSLNNPTALKFRAVGMDGAEWTLSITLTPSNGSKDKTYGHPGIIPDELVSDLIDTIDLT